MSRFDSYRVDVNPDGSVTVIPVSDDGFGRTIHHADELRAGQTINDVPGLITAIRLNRVLSEGVRS